MHSFLERWLHKCHRIIIQSLRSGDSKNGSKRPEPAAIPTKYICEELAREFSKYWTEMGENNGEGLDKIQMDALARWHAFQFDLDKCSATYPLPLDFFVKVFDDYFFLGSLHQYLTVSFTPETPSNSAWVGLTRLQTPHSLFRPPEIQIQLKPPPLQPWTRDLIQDLLDTLLHEMSHAFLLVYSTPGRYLERWRYRRLVETEGVTGHGPCWVKIASAVAAEADRALGELWDKWELKIVDSCELEEEALGETWKR